MRNIIVSLVLLFLAVGCAKEDRPVQQPTQTVPVKEQKVDEVNDCDDAEDCTIGGVEDEYGRPRKHKNHRFHLFPRRNK